MSKYETIMVYSLKKGEEAAKELMEKFKALMQSALSLLRVLKID